MKALCFLSILSFIPLAVLGRTIHIDPSTGEDASDCLTGKHPCGNLTWVLQQPHSSSTHYLLSEGTHYLTSPTPPFQHLSFLAFTGNSSVVTCTQSDTGLAFIDVANIIFHNVSFQNCSALRNSTSRIFDYDRDANFTYDLYEFHVALYFLRCSDITMTSLVVTESPSAAGVAIYDTVGTNIIADSSFTLNRLEAMKSTQHPGGGGLYLEFTYCSPGDLECEKFDEPVNHFNRDARFLFRNVSFCFNEASNLPDQHSETYIIPYQRIHNSFGKGGGLAAIFKGSTSNVTLEVLGCTFEGNEAMWGSGLAVEYQDHTHNVTVLIRDTVFTENGIDSRFETAGGGVRVGHYVYNLSGLSSAGRNLFSMDGCELSANHALNGGGVSVFPVRQLTHDYDHSQLFQVIVRNTTFSRNLAQVGAAMELTLFYLFTKGSLPLATVWGSRFENNSVHDHASMTSIREVGVGTVYTNGVPLQFRDDIVFEGNSGSALAVVGTRADFSDSHADFVANEGDSGGAIALLGSSYLLVNQNTSLSFMENRADVKGGAISNVFAARQNFKAYPNCFVRHDKPFLHPYEWGASFTFRDNSAAILGQSIYTTSLYPCAWSGGSGISNYSEILCWEGWEYVRNGSSVDCHLEMNTDSGSISFSGAHTAADPNDDTADPNGDTSDPYLDTADMDDGNSGTLILPVIPGREYRIPIRIQDDLGHLVNNQTVFTATSSDTSISRVNPRYTFVSGEYIKIDGQGGSNVTLQLKSDNERAWQLEVDVRLLDCPPGFVATREDMPSHSNCTCNKENYQGKVHCFQELGEARIVNGYWFGEIENENETVYATSLCLPGFCVTEEQNRLKKIPADSTQLEEKMCGENHRRGILCGECEEGYGPSVNSEIYRCIPCNDTSEVAANVVRYVFSTYLPLFLLFVFIIAFSVRLTSGPANAFIFYAQVVSSTFDLNADSHIPLELVTNHSEALLQAYRVPYGLFNLNFVEKFIGDLCVGSELTALDVLELEYLIASFPLVMILVVVLAVRVKDSTYFSYACSRCSFKRSSWRFLRHWKASESLLHAFSAFLLLSYIKFSLTSSYLVNIHPFYDASGRIVGERRAYYAGKYTASDLEYILRYQLPACLVLALVALPPIILFGYPVVWFEKCLIRVRCLWRLYPVDKVQIFLDTFQGCYRDDRRFFAGMYFAFRLAINVCYILTDDWLQQFVTQQVLCTGFLLVVALCWPYRKEQWYLNYVDLLVFANLATVNALSLYLFAYSQINSQQSIPELPVWPFVVQYVLVFLPLVYMLAYVGWSLLPARWRELVRKVACWPAKRLKKWKRERYLRDTLLGPSEGKGGGGDGGKEGEGKGGASSKGKSRRRLKQPGGVEYAIGREGISTTEITLTSSGEGSDEEEEPGSDDSSNLEAILTRAQTQNTYRRTTTEATPTQTYHGHAPNTTASSTYGSRYLTKDSGWSSLGHGRDYTTRSFTPSRDGEWDQELGGVASAQPTEGGGADVGGAGRGQLDTIRETDLSPRHNYGTMAEYHSYVSNSRTIHTPHNQ